MFSYGQETVTQLISKSTYSISSCPFLQGLHQYFSLQEEELDDLAGQVQMLEGAKVRLEMSIEQMRKENRREVSQREEELEEVRNSAQKKIKGIIAEVECTEGC